MLLERTEEGGQSQWNQDCPKRQYGPTTNRNCHKYRHYLVKPVEKTMELQNEGEILNRLVCLLLDNET